MATIINIRGTGGSGKSYLIHRLIKKFGISKKIVNHNRRPGYSKNNIVVGYRLKHDVLVVGKYETDCGGCDQIKSQDEICSRVIEFASKGSVVLFEGLLISGLYSRYLELSKKLRVKGHKYVWVFLNTDIEECCKRTKQRRLARGNAKPFNPKNTIAKFRAVQLAKEHACRDGENVITLNRNSPFKQLYSIIRKSLPNG